MRVQEITQILNTLFPLSLQEDYDNTGSQIVFPDSIVTGILLALDVDHKVVSEALDRGCEMIITHHPLFFTPLKRIDATDPKSALILSIIEKRISCFTSHQSRQGLFRPPRKSAGFPEGRVLLESRQCSTNRPGLWYALRLDSPVTLRDLLKRIKDLLRLEFIVYSGNLDMEISTVALLNGSGGSAIDRIFQLPAPIASLPEMWDIITAGRQTAGMPQ
jgi:putative NIF3 family GTP cyclohydrolase 1 type 2